MQVVHPRCCGIEVHKRSVVACVLLTAPDGTVRRRVSTFGTMTADLLALHDWLGTVGVTHIAMESTGVYWRPVYNLLEEEGRTILLVNPRHMRAVPGRKTEVRDAEWIAELLRHGLLRGSLIPPAPIRALRELTRYRKVLVAQRADEVNRVQKLLEGANRKLASVATDVLGVSGRAMLAALPEGQDDPEALAQLLAHIDYLEAAIADMQLEIARALAPYDEAVALLQTIPGVGPGAAAAIVAAIGVDMGRFPSGRHLAAWAGVCPGNKQSGGKRLGGKTTNGNVWLRAMLGEVAWSIARCKGTYLHAQFHRLARRRGKYRALLAVAHSVVVFIHHLLPDHRPYADLGADYFERLDTARTQQHHVRRLEQLGYSVTLTPAAA